MCVLMISLVYMYNVFLSPRALDIHIRQIPHAHVTTITYVFSNNLLVFLFLWCIFGVTKKGISYSDSDNQNKSVFLPV